MGIKSKNKGFRLYGLEGGESQEKTSEDQMALKGDTQIKTDVATKLKAAAAAAAAAEAEKPFDLIKESQRKGLLRKGRRSSILTSSQGASDPLGLPG